MKSRSVIPLNRICDWFHIDLLVIQDFADFGLFPVVDAGNETGLDIADLGRVRNVVSLYAALGINKEGIDVILDLRERISALQDEIASRDIELDRMKRRAQLQALEGIAALGPLVDIETI